MQKSDWHVMVRTNDATKRYYCYGPIEELADDDYYKDTIEVPESDWTPDDMATIIGNLLEDVNKHSITDEPNEILNTLRESNIEEPKIKRFMTLYMNRMFQNYGY